MQYNTATMAVTEPALGSLDAWIKTNYADTKAWNTEWRFTSEVIGEKVNPEIEKLTENIEAVSTAMAATESFLGPKGGGGAIDTSGMTIANQDELWRQYNATHMGSQVGGGEDVLSYGLRMGLIARGRAAGSMRPRFPTSSTSSTPRARSRGGSATRSPVRFSAAPW